jgi:hypothetical protein
MRIRIDHMLAFNWKFLTPLSFVLSDGDSFAECASRGRLNLDLGLSMFLSNVLVAWIALEIARSYSRRERENAEGSLCSLRWKQHQYPNRRGELI